MTNLKRWIEEMEPESQELTQKISWKSSNVSEEDEENFTKRKKFKPYFPKYESPMKIAKAEPLKLEKINLSKYENYVMDNSSISSQPSISSSSPIIGICQEVPSPILSQNPELHRSESPILRTCKKMSNEIETSPVLRCKNLGELKNRRFAVDRTTDINNASQDLFFSASQMIEENESPDYVTIKSTECSQQLNKIEIVSSQESSSLCILNSSTSDSSLHTSLQYTHYSDQRRKKFKNGGLFHQLENFLRLNTSRVSIWHHDIFCSNITPSQVEHVRGLVKNKWKDFGSIIVECKESDSKYVGVSDYFLVSIGFNTNSNILCDTGQIIRLFPPFREKTINFKNTNMKLYYNITKVLID